MDEWLWNWFRLKKRVFNLKKSFRSESKKKTEIPKENKSTKAANAEIWLERANDLNKEWLCSVVVVGGWVIYGSVPFLWPLSLWLSWMELIVVNSWVESVYFHFHFHFQIHFQIHFFTSPKQNKIGNLKVREWILWNEETVFGGNWSTRETHTQHIIRKMSWWARVSREIANTLNSMVCDVLLSRGRSIFIPLLRFQLLVSSQGFTQSLTVYNQWMSFIRNIQWSNVSNTLEINSPFTYSDLASVLPFSRVFMYLN